MRWLCLLFAVGQFSAGCATRRGMEPQDPVPRISVTQVESWSEEEVAAYGEAETRLDRRISVDFRQDRLEQALDYTIDQMGAGASVRWGAMELVGVDPDQPISMKLTNVPARRVLDEILSLASVEHFDDDKVSFVNDRGVVVVSTISELKKMTVTRIYDIRPLIRGAMLPLRAEFDSGRSGLSHGMQRWADQMYGHPLFEPIALAMYDWQIRMLQKDRAQVQRVLDEEGDGMRTMFFDECVLYSTAREQIEELVEGLFEGDAWVDPPEDFAREYNGDLIVTATLAQHLRVESLLNALLASEVVDRERVFADWEVCRTLDRAATLYLEGDMAGAEVLTDEALAIDPEHPTAVGFKRFIEVRSRGRRAR